MNDRDIDEILKKAAAESPRDPDAALLKAIAESLRPSLAPVRPIASAWALTGVLFLLCAAVAVAGAARAGFHGIGTLGLWVTVPVAAVLAVFAWLAASEFVGEMVPGSQRWISPQALMLLCTVAFLALFALLFRDYGVENFLSIGIVCLATGILHSIPVAILAFLILRRGFAVDPIGAGLASGILGGVAGLAMLELHCPNFETFHLLVWHTAVVPVSGLAAALVVWSLHRRSHL